MLGSAVRVVLGAFVVYSCAGKSISRTEGTAADDDPPPTADDGFTGGRPGAGGSVIGGTTGVAGTTTGGVSGRGGTAGTGGTAGRGGVGGRGGSAGLGGTGNVAGDDFGGDGPGGSDGCEPIRSGGVQATTCSQTPGCINPISPLPEHVERNELIGVGGLGGAGGEGGGADDDGDTIASAVLCSRPWGDGFLAFDYYMPEGGVADAQFTFFTGRQRCSGSMTGWSDFDDYALPPNGTWTTQCIAVREIELDNVATIGVTGARVKNVRFVSSCECPRQFTRQTTCGVTTRIYCR